MRLKLVILPLTLIVAFFVTIGFVYPQFKTAMDVNKSNMQLKEKLSALAQKAGNIQMLDQEIGANKSKEDYILSYVSNKRAEERAIDGINSLAEDNILVITDISIKNDPKDKISEEKKSSSNSLFNTENSNAIKDPNSEEVDINLKKTSLSVSLIGKYEDIKSFIMSVDRMSMANDISEVKISSADEEGGSAGSENASADETQVQSQGKILSAEISIDFYYSNIFESKDYLNEKVFESPNIDFTSIKAVEDYVKGGANKLEVISKSKINPFL